METRHQTAFQGTAFGDPQGFVIDDPKTGDPEERPAARLYSVNITEADGRDMEHWIATPNQPPPTDAPWVWITVTADGLYQLRERITEEMEVAGFSEAAHTFRELWRANMPVWAPRLTLGHDFTGHVYVAPLGW